MMDPASEVNEKGTRGKMMRMGWKRKDQVHY